MALELDQAELEILLDALDITDPSHGTVKLRAKLNIYAGNEPEGLREQLAAHQDATDCSDNTMVQIMCDFIEDLNTKADGVDYVQDLMTFVVDKLDCGPMGQGG